jgi:hypothetical protein
LCLYSSWFVPLISYETDFIRGGKNAIYITKKGKIANNGDGKSFGKTKKSEKSKKWDDGLSSDGSALSSLDTDDDEDMAQEVKTNDKRSGPDGFSTESDDTSDDDMPIVRETIIEQDQDDSSNSSALEGVGLVEVPKTISSQEIQTLAENQERIKNAIISLHSKFKGNMVLLNGLDSKFDVDMMNFDGVKGVREKVDGLFV